MNPGPDPQILQVAFDLAPLGCLVVKTDTGAVVACNPFLLDFMDWTLEDVLASDIQRLGLHSPSGVLRKGGGISVPVSIAVRTPSQPPFGYSCYFVTPRGPRDRSLTDLDEAMNGFFESFGDLGITTDRSLSDSRLTLSAGDQKLIRQLRGGMTNKAIAFESNRSIAAVKVAISNLYRRLGVTSRLELLNWLQGKSFL